MSSPFVSKLATLQRPATTVFALEAQPEAGIGPVVLTPGEWSIGSGAQCRIVLAATDVADVQAQLFVSDDQILVRAWADGVRHNGQPVEEAELAAGDRLQLGSVSFQLRAARPDEILAQVAPHTSRPHMSTRSPSSDQLLNRIGDIADTLDALERELHGEQHACDRLDQVIDRIQRSLAKSTSAPVESKTEHRDASLRTIRNQLDELAASIQQNLDEQSSSAAQNETAFVESPEDVELARLDDIIAQVQPTEDASCDWMQRQTAVATRMSRQLSQLLQFSQQLCSRAALLDEEATDLHSQRDLLKHERLQLDEVRVQLSQEREELGLQRDLLDEETEHFNRRIETTLQATPIDHANDADDSGLPYLDLSILGGSVSDVGNIGFGGDDSHQSHDAFASSNWSLDDGDADWSVAPSSTHTPSLEAFETPASTAAAVDVCEVNSFNHNAAPSNEPTSPAPALEHVTEGISELQRLVSKIEQATPTDEISDAIESDDIVAHDVNSEVEDDFSDETIDELPAASLFEEGLSQTTSSTSGMSSRDAAIAELDALLASYADEVLKPSLAQAGLANNDVSDADNDDVENEVEDESTFELASGETWYEGQPLEGEFLVNDNASIQSIASAPEPIEDIPDDEVAVVDESIDTVKDAQELVARTEHLLQMLRHEEPLVEMAASKPVINEPRTTEPADVVDEVEILDPADVFELDDVEQEDAEFDSVEANEVAVQELVDVIEACAADAGQDEVAPDSSATELTNEVETASLAVDATIEPTFTALEHRFSVEDADDVGFDEAQAAVRQALFEVSSRSTATPISSTEEPIIAAAIENAVEAEVASDIDDEIEADIESEIKLDDELSTSDVHEVLNDASDEVAPATPSLFSFAAAAPSSNIPTGSLLAQFLHHDEVADEPETIEAETDGELESTGEDDVDESATTSSLFGVSTLLDPSPESVAEQPTGFLLAQFKAADCDVTDNSAASIDEPSEAESFSTGTVSDEVIEPSAEPSSDEQSLAIEDTPTSAFEDDSMPTRPSLFGASSEPEVELPTGSLLAQLERKPAEDTDETKLTELRSQLADLFGIKNAPVIAKDPIAEDKPLADRFNSFFTGGKSVEELDEQGALVEAASPVLENSEPAPAEVLSGSKCEIEKPAAEAASSAPPAADDPIRAYMEQLIARTKQSANNSNEGKSSARAEGLSTIEGISTLADVALPSKKSTEQDYSWLSEGPKHKQDKDAVRANMQQLRQLANMQARSAVVRAGRKQLKTQIIVKLAGTVMSLIVGGTAFFLQQPMYAYLVCGIGLLFAGDLLLTIMRNGRVLSKQKKLARESSNAEVADQAELKANPRTEGRLDQFTRGKAARN